MNCRNCGAALQHICLDLGSAPLSNAYVTAERLAGPENWYPLAVYVCHCCWLVQANTVTAPNVIFDDQYAYFSSFSSGWVQHAGDFQRKITQDLALGASSFVLEIASNDGYLLKFFQEAGIRCLGVEPTASTAQVAMARGIDTLCDFFNPELADHIVASHGAADLIVGNNVLAHVPAPLSFLRGVRSALAQSGTATFEFPHVMSLIERSQFDTIYHEHFSYLSAHSVSDMARKSDLEIYKVEKLTTHGGSLRTYLKCAGSGAQKVDGSVSEVLREELRAGVNSQRYYGNLQREAEAMKFSFLRFLLEAESRGQRVVGYGAAAKGTTLLNFSGVRPDLLSYVVDRNPSKQGKFLPGCRIQIVDEVHLRRDEPDLVVIFPWNIKREVMEQLSYVREWGGLFVTLSPELEYWP